MGTARPWPADGRLQRGRAGRGRRMVSCGEEGLSNGMQRLETLSLEAFAKMCLTGWGTTKTPMHYGRIFVCSMRELRASVRNAIILLWKSLNVLVEEVNGLGLTQMQPSDVVRKILSVLTIDKYVHIVTVLHQGDLSTATPTQILGKINAHEMYMHITPQNGSSSNKKKDKDLAFKASQ